MPAPAGAIVANIPDIRWDFFDLQNLPYVHTIGKEEFWVLSNRLFGTGIIAFPFRQ